MDPKATESNFACREELGKAGATEAVEWREGWARAACSELGRAGCRCAEALEALRLHTVEGPNESKVCGLWA